MRTASAVPVCPGDEADLYRDRIAAYRRGDFAGLARPLRVGGAMRYEASGERLATFQVGGESYTDVHVVRLGLTWRIRTGPGEDWGYWFEKERVVVFSRAGAMLAVHGDGRTPVAVS